MTKELRNRFAWLPGIAGAISFVLITSFIGCSMERAAMEQGVPPGTTQSAPAAAGAGETIKNLQVAFNGESNARAKYLEYAKKADSEGYKNVASLFRAAARSEQIHAANHSEVIRAMGETPVAEVKLPEIGSTEENLKDALKGETYERDVMYADFLKQARAVGNTKAVLTFNFAKAAETEHANLYASALQNLGIGKDSPQTFYVCPKCGFTTPDPDIRKCPVDFTPKKEFETVS